MLNRTAVGLTRGSRGHELSARRSGLPGQAHCCPVKEWVDGLHGLDSTVFCDERG